MPEQIVLDLAERKEFGRYGYVYPLGRVIQRSEYVFYERDFVDHPRIKSIESVVFPNLNFKASRFYNNRGTPHPYLWYVDIVEAKWEEGDRLRVIDLYLDVIQFRDRSGYTVVDIDEFREAFAKRDINEAQVLIALRGLETVCRAFDANRGQFLPYLQRLMSGEGFRGREDQERAAVRPLDN